MASETVKEIRDYLHDEDTPTCDVLERWADELEATQAEVERLRAALRMIAENPQGKANNFAKDVLSGG